MTLIEVAGVSCDVDDRRLFVPVSFAVTAGESLAIVGPSGSGKTSLLSVLAGLTEPSAGSVTRPAETTGGLAFVLQSHGLIPVLTASENVEISLRSRGSPGRAAVERAARALADVGLEDQADQLADELSGGQQQRVAVARALAGEPALVIADEPTAEQDRATRALVLTRLFDVVGRGGGLVLATHDPAVAERCTRVLDLATSPA